MASRFIVGMDIGTSSVKATLIERRGKSVSLRRAIEEPIEGLRKGVVCDLGDAMPAVRKIADSLRLISRSAPRNMYVNIGTPQIKVHHSRGIVAVSRVDSEIYQDDIDRVVKASQAVNMGPNRMIVHTITKEFMVDGVEDISHPLGLSGSRLEVQSMVVEAFSPHVKNIMKLVEMAGGAIGGLALDPIATARAALTKTQRELGVLLIDIGFGTTNMAVYEENKLSALHTFPVGAGNITNDIAVGLKIPVEVAEEIKMRYGYAYSRDVNRKDSVDLSELMSDAKADVSRRFISEIIEARLAEVFEFVNNELKGIERSGELPGGVVLTGGGARMPGIVELAKSELKLSAQIGSADVSAWISEESPALSETISDPEFVTAIGLALWGGDEEGWWHDPASTQSPRWNIRQIIKSFMP